MEISPVSVVSVLSRHVYRERRVRGYVSKEGETEGRGNVKENNFVSYFFISVRHDIFSYNTSDEIKMFYFMS